MMKGFLFSFLILASTAYCSLQDHFKKAEGKTDGHSMRNIDFIYMINLDRRPEKWKASLAQLQPYGIEPYRFSAVNGWELSLEDINDVGVKFQKGMKEGVRGTWYPLDGDFKMAHEPIAHLNRTYFSECMSRGAIGIVLSHLSILQDAYDQGYETIWVMEDDIEIAADPNYLSSLIEKLDRLVGEQNWDILFTDQDTRSADGKYVPCFGFAERPDFTPSDSSKFKKRRTLGEFKRIGARYGAYSTVLRRSGIEKILNFYRTHPIFLPYDLEYYLPEGISIYTVASDIVRHRLDAPSDNGNAHYKEIPLNH